MRFNYNTKLKYINKFIILFFVFFINFFVFQNNVQAGQISDITLEYDSKNKKIVFQGTPAFEGIKGVWADCYYTADNSKKYIPFYGGSCGNYDDKDALEKSIPVRYKASASDLKNGEYKCTIKSKYVEFIFGCQENVEKDSLTINIVPGENSANVIPDNSGNKSENQPENNSDDSSSVDCNSWGDAKRDMQNIFNFMKIVIPLLIIGLSTFDFIKAIVEKDDKDIKKAFKKLLKRFAFAILFFFIPVILDLLLYFFEINNEICIK